MILTEWTILSNNEINCPAIQGFPHIVKGCGRDWKFCWGVVLFYRVVGTSGGVLLTIQTFFKVKTAFHEYWTSIKMKISMTYLHSMKFKKKVQEQWLQLKWSFYWFIIWKLLFNEGLTIGGDEGQGEWANFLFNVFSQNSFKGCLQLCI